LENPGHLESCTKFFSTLRQISLKSIKLGLFQENRDYWDTREEVEVVAACIIDNDSREM
jgi:hypothetical protein